MFVYLWGKKHHQSNVHQNMRYPYFIQRCNLRQYLLLCNTKKKKKRGPKAVRTAWSRLKTNKHTHTKTMFFFQ